jgi:hypothetical protein
MKKIVYILIALFTSFALILIYAHFIYEEHFTKVSIWITISEIIVTIVIFSIGELLSKKEIQHLSNKNREIKNCITFVSSFEKYCHECGRIIGLSENNSTISTIQTPIYLESKLSPNDGYYRDYINKTVNQLLLKNDTLDCCKILSYRRLVVISDETNKKEIEDEKYKLQVFVNEIYSQLSNGHLLWKPPLNNIHIGIIKSKDIASSPFSNLDVLLIKNNHLVFAFPLEDDNSYIWGTSIHLDNNSGHIDEFPIQVEKFEQIYHKVWISHKIRKIDFGKIHYPENLGISKKNIFNEIESQFNLL